MCQVRNLVYKVSFHITATLKREVNLQMHFWTYTYHKHLKQNNYGTSKLKAWKRVSTSMG